METEQTINKEEQGSSSEFKKNSEENSPYAQMQVQSDNENRSRNKTEENAVISVMK